MAWVSSYLGATARLRDFLELHVMGSDPENWWHGLEEGREFTANVGRRRMTFKVVDCLSEEFWKRTDNVKYKPLMHYVETHIFLLLKSGVDDDINVQDLDLMDEDVKTGGEKMIRLVKSVFHRQLVFLALPHLSSTPKGVKVKLDSSNGDYMKKRRSRVKEMIDKAGKNAMKRFLKVEVPKMTSQIRMLFDENAALRVQIDAMNSQMTDLRVYNKDLRHDKEKNQDLAVGFMGDFTLEKALEKGSDVNLRGDVVAIKGTPSYKSGCRGHRRVLSADNALAYDSPHGRDFSLCNKTPIQDAKRSTTKRMRSPGTPDSVSTEESLASMSSSPIVVRGHRRSCSAAPDFQEDRRSSSKSKASTTRKRKKKACHRRSLSADTKDQSLHATPLVDLKKQPSRYGTPSADKYDDNAYETPQRPNALRREMEQKSRPVSSLAFAENPTLSTDESMASSPEDLPHDRRHYDVEKATSKKATSKKAHRASMDDETSPTSSTDESSDSMALYSPDEGPLRHPYAAKPKKTHGTDAYTKSPYRPGFGRRSHHLQDSEEDSS